MKKLRVVIASIAVMIGLIAPLTPQLAYAQQPTDPRGQAQSGVNAIGGEGRNDFPTILRNIINIMLFIIGAIAVLMIVIGGLRYVTSGGDSASVTGAKNTVLYAVIGLIVAIMAYGIVNFILDSIT
ncbi:MAG TPA: pilin [Verrucomicrobiae bacterium]|nr:pilin [Verrucomicrobiae bacterium]